MKAYACVYRHPIPTRNARRKTELTAANNPMLRRYVDSYDDEHCYWDWGDDPSFYAATAILGSPERATWGVCRRLVRRRLDPGDFVAFFCARQLDRYRWDYFYIGVGTIGDLLSREQVWTDDDYRQYRDFFNILARPVDGVLQQHETIHEFHNKDWHQRAVAAYIVFDPTMSRFEMHRPVHVASYDRADGGIEVWNDDDERVRTIAKLILPDPPSTRGLRTTHPQMSHPELPLKHQAERAGGFAALRSSLLEVAET